LINHTKVALRGAAGRDRTADACLFRSSWTILFSTLQVNGDWALARDYCWDSPASLYTFLATICPARLGSGLSRTALPCLMFPEFTQFFNPSYLGKPRRLQGIALPLSYRGITL